MRFVRSGVNWEGRTWSTPGSLRALMDEIEAAFPAKHATDGTVASQTHDAVNPTSDHRPTPYTGPGMVRAVDAGDDGTIFNALVKARDSRLRYAINNGKIVASYSTNTRPAWTVGPYTGANPHKDHTHASVVAALDSVSKPWNLDFGTGGDMAFEDYVHDIQADLNTVGFTDNAGNPLTVDGIWGSKTRQAFRNMMKAAKAPGPKGPKGDPGPEGPKGAKGKDGVASVTVNGAQVFP